MTETNEASLPAGVTPATPPDADRRARLLKRLYLWDPLQPRPTVDQLIVTRDGETADAVEADIDEQRSRPATVGGRCSSTRAARCAFRSSASARNAAVQRSKTCSSSSRSSCATFESPRSRPAGPGAEAVLDRQGTVVTVREHCGVRLQPGQRSVQATGNLTGDLTALHPGQRADLRTVVTDGRSNLQRRGVTLVNGGPQLLQHGNIFITQARDGMVHATDPSFAYGWALQRNPRTFAGVDSKGRTVLVTVDGRQPTALGLSLLEEARVAKALGMVQAMNLDGGGSTAMAIDGSLISHPSDAAGERPVGDVIYLK